MRTVILDGREGRMHPCPLRDKLAGHLNARLMEYEGDGIVSRTEDGVITARIGKLNGQAAVTALAETGVYACPYGGEVRFLIGPHTVFEELDYVQAAAAGLL